MIPRAGWWGSWLSASKLWNTVSTSGPSSTVKPRPRNTSSSSRWVAVIRCRRPTGWGGVPGQRDVDAVGGQARVELGARSSRVARLDQRSSACRASLAARPTAPRCSAGQLGHAAQQLRQLRPGDRGSARAAPPGRRWTRRRRWPPRPRCAGRRWCRHGHGAGTLSRVISYSATVAAIAAFSDSPAIGMRAARSQRVNQLVRQSVAFAPDQQRDRSAPVAAASRQRSRARRGGRRARSSRRAGSRGRRRRGPARPRRSRPCWPCTALGP